MEPVTPLVVRPSSPDRGPFQSSSQVVVFRQGLSMFSVSATDGSPPYLLICNVIMFFQTVWMSQAL